ncbi:hypothetical protein ACFQ05_37400 [Amycolatopsis umgeniensis]|uniref:DUF2180 family protein n=1 Tax=Amycolatopsis umgeniensis TaxID=336628 RepID=A0A841AXL0_9PSEU|nr:hypothetical protein [Amycolatopsis umgeniensis]MBB5851102.1 hypothetical protein [Amycolatopsis umgeniensis]
MVWKCGDCNTREGEEEVVIDAVCHHCGKPLCGRHQKVVETDEGFAEPRSDAPVSVIRSAVHCETCVQAHHSRATFFEGV